MSPLSDEAGSSCAAFVQSVLEGQAWQRLLLERARHHSGPVYMFGAGVYAYVAKRFLELSGVPLAGVLVDEDRRTDALFYGLPVTSIEALPGLAPRAMVLVCVTDHTAIVERLRTSGLPDTYAVDVPDYLNMPQAFLTADFVTQNQQRLHETFLGFEDQLSRQSYVASLRAKLHEDPVYLEPVTRRDHIYFCRTEFELVDDEVFLDVGGYDGDTVRDFRMQTRDQFRRIVSLEPDAENFAALAREAARAGPGRAVALNVGAWDTCATLHLPRQAGQIDNQIGGAHGPVIAVDRIDDIVAAIPERFTLMKFDINGAEHKALSGARQRIARDRPRIVTRLHTKEDYFRIAELLRSISPDVQLYLRQRSPVSLMVFLYAVFPQP